MANFNRLNWRWLVWGLAGSGSIFFLAIALLFFQPRWLLSIVSAIAPGAVYFSDTDERIVALTIDDGPDAIATPKILQLLARYRSRATFFLISSRISGNESLVMQAIREGQELGNHLTEDEPSIDLSPEAFEANLLEAEAVLSQFASPRWLRPASGWYNSQIIATAQKHGYRVALGSIFPYDTNIPSVQFAAHHILTNVRPGDIIILHDGGDRGDRTVSVLEIVLPELQRQGYRIVSLSELLPPPAD
ncbi:polysaccharide deacetylase family protein [Oscillatoriales cyanobacterium LEGE 11467]|uniref:Polysaccharide deacetylase family protein n=1 Tax=Zarconia navalis LEGE 11467 TaxID=1828826 RepID=A0A928Z8Z9_9CYAN|nr:chitin deacetylase family protein [Zarconia navalis]MBE9042070.1 polysaccharide deacetylase family protein [Zarconia navalis LEGE 11467]